MHKIEVQHLIPFHDVDLLGVAWHGHYAKYFELARTKFFQDFEMDVDFLKAQKIAMPVVDLQIKFKKWIPYNEKVVIEASSKDIFYPAIVVDYKIKSLNGEVLSEGYTKQVYVNMETHEPFYGLPDVIEEKFKKFSGQLSL